MRTLKNQKFDELKSLLRKDVGGLGLQWMSDYASEIGLKEEIFSLVYESFWDLYTFKSCVDSFSAKKLQLWINKITPVVRSVREKQADDEDEEGVVANESLRAIVRIKVPK